MKPIFHLIARFGLWLHEWGLKHSDPPWAAYRASGDVLTRWGLLYGCERETDEKYRKRILGVIQPRRLPPLAPDDFSDPVEARDRHRESQEKWLDEMESKGFIER